MRKLLLFFTFSLAALAGFSQNLQRYNWYYGNSTQAVRFNRTSAKPSLVTKAIPFGQGGSATASDPANANLMFYTDGQFVFDATNKQMPGGSGLTGATSSNQPVAICAVPGTTNANKYFIFLNSASFPAPGTITARVVNMALSGNSFFPAPALGDLEPAVIPTGLANRAEGMTIVPHSNGTDFWLITQQINSLTLTYTLIDSITYTGTFTNTTANVTSIPMSAANLAYHEGKKKIAVSAQDTNTDAIIVDFNNTTGGFTFDRFIFNSGVTTATPQSIYDIEWSLKGDFIYISRYGEPGIQADLLQYDFLNPLTTLTTVLPAPVFRSFGVQMGPDSAIYHLYQTVAAGPILLGKIAKTDTVAAGVKYSPAQLTATSFAGTQFAALLPKADVTLKVNFSFIGSCQNNNTTFFPDVKPGADSLQWDFGDGSPVVRDWSPVHKFTTASTFSVSLKAFYKGQTQSSTQPVLINPFALKLSLVQDTTACRSEFPPPRGSSSPKQFSVKVSVQGGTASTYDWSNGDTGPILTPDSAGYYYVVVSDGSGCSVYAGVNVKEYGLQDQRSNIWYFGQNAGIDFNTTPNPPKPLSNSAMNAPAGCAIICDRNGKAIFYTDGDKVYNKKDLLITGGIGGDPEASQSSIIVPVTGDETLYYIFTNEAINGGSMNMVRYSLFDLKKNAGLGDVVIKNQDLFSKGTERITASGKWLVIHEYGNNTFRVYPIDTTGIGDPILTAIGSDHSFQTAAEGQGYMKLGPKNMIAVALSNPGVSNLIELFHLNDTTGEITNYRKIDLKQPQGQVYGIEFSPGGNKVYATVKGTAPFNVFEYFIDSLGHPYYKTKKANTTGKDIGAIQRAPDGQIYMALEGSNMLGTIQPVDDTTQVSPVNFAGFALAAGTTSHLGLPNFIQQINNAAGGPDFTFAGVCLGTPTKFVGTPTDAIDKFFWTLGDGATDTQAAVTHTYATAATYTVSMHLTNRCGLDTTLVKPVTVFAPPPKPLTTQAAVALCNGPVTLDANTGNLPGITYAWSGGQMTKTITVTAQAFISVTITDTNGCTNKGVSLVADNQPQVDLGPDQTLCQNAFASALDAQNPGNNYAWTVNGGSPTSAQSRPLDTTLPGIFTYSVTVTDPITTCIKTDAATFTIKASPSFTLGGSNPTSCGAGDGTLSVTLLATVPVTGPYSYFITGPGGFNQQAFDQNAPLAVPPFTGLGAGVYSGVVSDQVSGCTISQSFGLTDAVWTTSIVKTSCDPADVTVSIATGVPVLPLQYSYTSTTHPAQGPNTINTATLASGDWVIQVRDNNGTGCINTTNLTVPPSVTSVSIAPSLCTTPATLNATPSAPASSYIWTGPGIVSGGGTSTININASGLYEVTATIAGCPVKQTITAEYDNPVVNFTQSDPCQNNVILSATPSGNYTYRWLQAATQVGLGQFFSIGLAQNGQAYQVEARNTLNGCAYLSTPPKPAQVTGIVDSGLTSTPACDDNKPFTLTAITSASGVTYTWYLNNTVITGQSASTTSQTSAGTYKVEISKATCKSASQISITKAPLPVGKLKDREIICNDPENKDPKTNQVDLDPGKFSAYDWYKNDLSINYTAQIYTTTSQGKFRVDLTNSFGCVAPDYTEVRNECIPKIDAPNAFRPSSSLTENKEFSIFTFFISTDNFQVFIYNRWGELVYTSTDRYFKWNGGLNNSLSQPLPGGSYAYVIKYMSSFHPERGTQEYRSGVALLR